MGDKLPFKTVADIAIQRHTRLWKPSTLVVNLSYLRNQIMPFFADRTVDEITRNDVQRWVSKLHATPSAANRALPVLSVVFQVAESLGLRPVNSNPCSNIRRFHTTERKRFLTDEEYRRLGDCLRATRSSSLYPITAIQLLALTGCRQGEIRTLLWRNYRQGHLFLQDSKTGPRTVWLSSVARNILDNLPRNSKWIFPAKSSDGPLSSGTLHWHWIMIRDNAGLRGVRLHDLRHSYASLALRRGETVLTIGRLLGHRDPATTLRYVHFDDSLALQAVQKVGDILGSL